MTSPHLETSLSLLTDLDLALAEHHVAKLIRDTNQASARCGPGLGWSSVLERLEAAMADYARERWRRSGA
ncbi:hypothetical protein D3C80_1800520 [compost metagenome]